MSLIQTRNILNIEEKPFFNESIEEYEYHENQLAVGTTLDNGEIIINIDRNARYFYPSL